MGRKMRRTQPDIDKKVFKPRVHTKINHTLQKINTIMVSHAAAALAVATSPGKKQF